MNELEDYKIQLMASQVAIKFFGRELEDLKRKHSQRFKGSVANDF